MLAPGLAPNNSPGPLFYSRMGYCTGVKFGGHIKVAGKGFAELDKDAYIVHILFQKTKNLYGRPHKL